MTELELDRRIRTALLQANWAEYALSPGEEEPELPAGLRRRMRPLLADPFGRRRRARRALGRCAAAAVLALSVSFGALMAVSPDARAWVQRVTVQILEKYTTIRFAGESGASGQPGDWAPTWLPEGYELTSEIQDPFYSILYYSNASGNSISLHFMPSNGNSFNVDNEHHEQITTRVNGTEAVLYLASEVNQRSSLIWEYQNQNTAFLLLGDLSIDDLIKIAESVKNS